MKKYLPHKSSILHLRFPFSFFLMPVYMFALSTAPGIYWPTAILAFLVLHFLVFPSSNGYNSTQDHDESSIGALKTPPPVPVNLPFITLAMDILAVAAGIFISPLFALLVLLFILVSRAYSNRKIRLKRYPVLSFIIVSLFQGGLVYLMSLMAILNLNNFSFINILVLVCMAIATFFIGSIYPLTQIYQHQSDKNDGVITISFKLGYRGTFIFSSIWFLLATFLVYVYFDKLEGLQYFRLFLLWMIPVVVWFLLWFVRVFQNPVHASYTNTMYMNIVTAGCMNLFFLFLIVNRYAGWY